MSYAISGELREQLTGLFRGYFNDQISAVFQITPSAEHSALTGEYTVPNDAMGFASRESEEPRNATLKSDFIRGEDLAYKTIATALTPCRSEFYEVVEREIQALKSANPSLDPVDATVRRVMGSLANGYVSRWITAANTLTATSVGSGTLALAARTVELNDFISQMQEEFYLSTGWQATHFVCGPKAARNMAAQNGLIDGSISITTTPSSARTGSSALQNGQFTRLKEYLLAECGVELVVDITRRSNEARTSGSYRFNNASGENGYLLREAGSTDSTLLTLAQGMTGADIWRMDVRDLVHPRPAGVSVAADGALQIHVAAPEAGRKVAITF
jgi:hypothetical protein